MFLFLAKRIPKSPLLSRFCSANPYPKTPRFVVADYLVSSFGFSPNKAATVSRTISHIKSPANPDSVRRLLNEQGFSEADVKRLITWRPKLLCSNPEKTLDPKLRTLRTMGLSTSALNEIILSSPNALLLHLAVPRITFWMDFLGGNEAALVKAFTYNRALITCDICQDIVPKISLLQTHGFSNLEIQRIACTIPRFITSRIGWMEDLLNRAKELGFQPGSRLFLQGLNAVTSVTKDSLKKKMVLLKSYGWSEDDFFSAVRNAPLVVALKEENLHGKMNFFLGEARCSPSYIATHPMLLTFSLEKRSRPRHQVLHLLETKGFCQKHRVLYKAICISNNDFVERYVLPHKKKTTSFPQCGTLHSWSHSKKKPCAPRRISCWEKPAVLPPTSHLTLCCLHIAWRNV